MLQSVTEAESTGEICLEAGFDNANTFKVNNTYMYSVILLVYHVVFFAFLFPVFGFRQLIASSNVR